MYSIDKALLILVMMSSGELELTNFDRFQVLSFFVMG